MIKKSRLSISEQIKKPQWQKRRLEIMQRDNFSCQICGDKESTLNVHHFHYDNARKYWEYEDWELITLCERCHTNEHSYSDVILMQVEQLRKRGVTMFEIGCLLEVIDIAFYLGREDAIHMITGDSTGTYGDDEIKRLMLRRKEIKENGTT